MVNAPPRKVRNIANGTPGPFSPVENGPPGPFSTVENGPGVHFQRRKMDRGGGPFSTGENGPGGPFSTGENGPGVHFQRGSIFNLTPAWYSACHPLRTARQRRSEDLPVVFYSALIRKTTL